MESTNTNSTKLSEDTLLANQTNKLKDMSLDQKVRKLASIQIIEKVLPHTNADKLEIAKVLGWEVIVPANLYKPGDKIVYFEIDSKLPEAPWSEIMRKEKFQVKTRKIRDRLTQGLIMPLSILSKNAEDISEKYDLGADVTKALGVTKYENDADLLANATPALGNTNKAKALQADGDNASATADEKLKKKEEEKRKIQEKKRAKEETLAKHQAELAARRESNEFPEHLGIPKTDEPRIQSFPELLEAFQGKPYYASLKYDGCSATYCFDIANPIKREKNQNQNQSKNKNKKRGNKNFSSQKTSEANLNNDESAENQENNNLNDVSLEDTFDFLICSRNYIATESHYKKAEETYKIREKLEKAGYHIAIQCEIYGPKIGKNPQQMKSATIAVFNVFDINAKRYYDLDEMEKFCKEFDLPMVHVLEKGDAFNYGSIEELLEKVKGNYEGTEHPREGIVFRIQRDFHLVYDEEEVCDKLGDISNEEKKKYLDGLKRMSFKVINNEYLVSKNPKK